MSLMAYLGILLLVVPLFVMFFYVFYKLWLSLATFLMREKTMTTQTVPESVSTAISKPESKQEDDEIVAVIIAAQMALK